MPERPLDAVEWELVRADIAMEKARLKANGDWSKWEEFQRESNAMRAGYVGAFGWRPRPARPESRMTEEERAVLWRTVRTAEQSGAPTRPPRRPRSRGWPLRWGFW
jgi:hypothetical protein